jgi:hypothetical protein
MKGEDMLRASLLASRSLIVAFAGAVVLFAAARAAAAPPFGTLVPFKKIDADFVLQRVRALAGEVFARLQRQGFRACRTVTITVRFAHFRTLTRSRTSRDAIASEEALYAGAAQLFAPFFDARENPRGTKIRLIGVRAEKLQ